MNKPVPEPIVRARRLAGALLVVSFAIVIVAIVLILNWYLNRPVTL